MNHLGHAREAMYLAEGMCMCVILRLGWSNA